MPASLPSVEEADAALKSFYVVPKAKVEDRGEVSEPWRSITLRCLEFGTDYNVPRGERPSEPLTGRTASTLQFLIDALSRFDREYRAFLKSQNAKPAMNNNKSSSGGTATPHSVMIDSLWLVGCLLDPSQQSESYDALRFLVHGLSSVLPSRLLQISLEPSLLAASGLLPGSAAAGPTASEEASAAAESAMQKRLKKINTDMFYRQTKFNLLQEESEGYAKLLALLTSLPIVENGHNHATTTTKAVTGSQDSITFSSSTAALRVRELIGTFDLDPNRVLDITLDILESELRVSTLPNSSSKQSSSPPPQAQPNPHHFVVFRNRFSHAPKQASTVYQLLQIIQQFKQDSTAHLLGFKFTNYRKRTAEKQPESSNNAKAAAEDHDLTPESLYVTAALLSLHGQLDLTCLAPHLDDDGGPSFVETLAQRYKAQQKEYMQRILKMGSISLNASKSSGSATADAKTATSAPMRATQIVRLFATMLQLSSSWEDAIALFGNDFQAASATATACCVLFPHAVGRHVCEFVQYVLYRQGCRAETVGCGPQMISGSRKGVAKKSSLSSTAEKDAMDSGMVNHFSLLPLKDPPAKTSLAENDAEASKEELSVIVQQIQGPLQAIRRSGSIRDHPILYCTMCRLLQSHFRRMAHPSDDEDEEVVVSTTDIEDGFYKLLRGFLVPSLSLFPNNPSLSSELWSVLRLLPYDVRYGLYGHWKGRGLEKTAIRGLGMGNLPKKPLPLVESEVATGLATRYVLKRMSKDNVRDMGRQLCRVSHNNPLVVFVAILGQIEGYDNLISMMVEAFRYVTLLGLDVLGYCLMVSLGGGAATDGSRSKMKSDGLNASQWLSSLETFTGAFYKKFPEVELRGILSYIVKQLQEGHVVELGILRSLLKTAGGYGFADLDSTGSLSAPQLEGRSGSQLLQRETSDFGIVEKVNRKASKRLRTVLQSGDIGISILILLAQVRHSILHKSGSSKHLKLLGNLYDTCQAVTSLLLDFLTDSEEEGSSNRRQDSSEVAQGDLLKYAKSIPSLAELNKSYMIEASFAWMLCRPLVRAVKFAGQEKQSKNGVVPNGHAEGKEAALKPALRPFAPASIQSAYASMLPEETWKSITPEVFEIFFLHALYDIHCPEQRYRDEIARLNKEADRLTSMQKGNAGATASLAAAAAAAGGSHREVQEATVFTRTQELELERVKRSSSVLASDLARQQKHCETIRGTIKARLKDFLSSDQFAGEKSSTALLTFCILPRALLRPEEGWYGAVFISFLREAGMKGTDFVRLIGTVVDAVSGSLYCLSEDEAGNISVFTTELWKLLSKWRYGKDLFEKDLQDKTPTTETGEEKSPCDYKEYCKCYATWHETLGQAVLGCLRSSEYIYTRCALILLARMVNVYPTRPGLGENIFGALETLKADDERLDLKAMAQAYFSQLVKARDDGVWQEEDRAAVKARQEKEKRQVEERRKNAEKQFEEMAIDMARGDGRNRPVESRGPRDAKAPLLNAGAPNFVPKQGAREGPQLQPPQRGRELEKDRDKGRDRDTRDASFPPPRIGRNGREDEYHSERTRNFDRDQDRDTRSAPLSTTLTTGPTRQSSVRRTGDVHNGGPPDARGPGETISRSATTSRWERDGGGEQRTDRSETVGTKRPRSPSRGDVGADSGSHRKDRSEAVAKRARSPPRGGSVRDRDGGGRDPEPDLKRIRTGESATSHPPSSTRDRNRNTPVGGGNSNDRGGGPPKSQSGSSDFRREGGNTRDRGGSPSRHGRDGRDRDRGAPPPPPSSHHDRGGRRSDTRPPRR